MKYLYDCLGLESAEVEGIRYQLLHRTAFALIEADRYHASSALMLIHSFSPSDKWFEDFEGFAALLEVKAEVNKIVYASRHDGCTFSEIELYLGWIRGEGKYLEV